MKMFLQYGDTFIVFNSYGVSIDDEFVNCTIDFLYKKICGFDFLCIPLSVVKNPLLLRKYLLDFLDGKYGNVVKFVSFDEYNRKKRLFMKLREKYDFDIKFINNRIISKEYDSDDNSLELFLLALINV